VDSQRSAPGTAAQNTNLLPLLRRPRARKIPPRAKFCARATTAAILPARPPRRPAVVGAATALGRRASISRYLPEWLAPPARCSRAQKRPVERLAAAVRRWPARGMLSPTNPRRIPDRSAVASALRHRRWDRRRMARDETLTRAWIQAGRKASRTHCRSSRCPGFPPHRLRSAFFPLVNLPFCQVR
jgi:hypothetical protein